MDSLNENRFYPEMASLANSGVNPRACPCGDLQAASAQALDFTDIGKPGPAAKRWDCAGKRVKKKYPFPDKRGLDPSAGRKASYARSITIAMP